MDLLGRVLVGGEFPLRESSVSIPSTTIPYYPLLFTALDYALFSPLRLSQDAFFGELLLSVAFVDKNRTYSLSWNSHKNL